MNAYQAKIIRRLRRDPSRPRGKRVLVVGCGNIGSQLVPLVARMKGIGMLILVDCDGYEESNLSSQSISSSDIGRAKAFVQARIARKLNPRLRVLAIHARLECVPLGWLRSDVMLACLDSKEARRCANEIAWRLGTPLIDAGIEASGLLARVNIYRPAANQPCLECAWDRRDYAQLPVKHPCDAGLGPSTPTGAPACLGALAAALQALECLKILAGDLSNAGKQILIEAGTHRHFLTGFSMHPKCRFNHAGWNASKISRTPAQLSVGAALRLASDAGASLTFAGMHLARQLDCPGCGFSPRVYRLEERLSRRERICPQCGQDLLVAGFHSQSQLKTKEVEPVLAARSLASLGLRGGDFISIKGSQRESFYELGGAPAVARSRLITRSIP